MTQQESCPEKPSHPTEGSFQGAAAVLSSLRGLLASEQGLGRLARGKGPTDWREEVQLSKVHRPGGRVGGCPNVPECQPPPAWRLWLCWLWVTLAGTLGRLGDPSCDTSPLVGEGPCGAAVGLTFACSSPFPGCPGEVRESRRLSRGSRPPQAGPGEGSLAGPSSLPLSLPAPGLGRGVEGRSATLLPGPGQQALHAVSSKDTPAAPAMDRWYLGEFLHPCPPSFSSSDTGVHPVTSKYTHQPPRSPGEAEMRRGRVSEGHLHGEP